jgi:hypothetical protein
MELLRQDVVLAIWMAVDRLPGRKTLVQLARALHVSPSQAHAAIARATTARLLVPAANDGSGKVISPQRANLLEFVVHGVKYAFPAERGGETRGVPTMGGAPVFQSEFGRGVDQMVWPHAEGSARGDSLSPLHPVVPLIALENAGFHDALALVDALRAGTARERKFAEKKIQRVLATVP